MELCELLKNNPYPGRGIALGRSADDRRAVMVYFIMGRSENSRNRSPTGTRPIPSGTFWRRGFPLSRPCGPGNLSLTDPTGPPVSPD